MNENDVGHVFNLSSEGQVANLPPEAPPRSDSGGPSDRQPLAEQSGDGTRSVPATSSGQVENLSYEQALDRFRSHPDLTPAMRQRLAELVQGQQPEQGPPQIPLDGVLAILAETIPSQLRLADGELSPAPHPEGEAFFTGDAASDADKQAAAVAGEQLALSGLLRST